MQKNEDEGSNVSIEETYEPMFQSLAGVRASIDCESIQSEQMMDEAEEYGDDILKLIEQYNNDMGVNNDDAEFRKQYYEEHDSDSESEGAVEVVYNNEVRRKPKKKEFVMLNNCSIKSSGYGITKQSKHAKKKMKSKYDKLKAIQQQIIENRALQSMLMNSNIGNVDQMYEENDNYVEPKQVSGQNANSRHKVNSILECLILID